MIGIRLVPVAVLLSVLAVGATVAAPIGIAVDEPGTVEPGEGTTITYELTNVGNESTSALGLELTTVPDEATVESISTANGTVAPDQNAVFWVAPVEPGETVAVTAELVAGQNISVGAYSIEASISSSSFSATEETEFTVESSGERPEEGSETSGGTALSQMQLVGLIVLVGLVLYFVVWRRSNDEDQRGPPRR